MKMSKSIQGGRISRWFYTAAFLCLPLVLMSCAPPVDKKMAEKTVDQLIIDLKNSDGLTRAKAAIALGARGVDAREAVPKLIKMLADPKPYVRNRAVDALGKIGDSAVPTLIEANTMSKDRGIRFFSAMALKKIPSDQAQTAYKDYMDREGGKILKNF